MSRCYPAGGSSGTFIGGRATAATTLAPALTPAPSSFVDAPVADDARPGRALAQEIRPRSPGVPGDQEDGVPGRVYPGRRPGLKGGIWCWRVLQGCPGRAGLWWRRARMRVWLLRPLPSRLYGGSAVVRITGSIHRAIRTTPLPRHWCDGGGPARHTGTRARRHHSPTRPGSPAGPASTRCLTSALAADRDTPGPELRPHDHRASPGGAGTNLLRQRARPGLASSPSPHPRQSQVP